MNKLVHALVALALIPSLGARHIAAEKRLQPKDFVTVEITIGKEEIFHKFKVPIVVNPKERKLFDADQYEGGGWGSTESCSKDIGCEYEINIFADAITEDKVIVMAYLSFKDKKRCSAEKEFLVIKGKPTELKSNCSTRIKAYYGSQSSAAKPNQ